MEQPKRLVLASTSPYRKALLERLGLRFDLAAPGVDETALPGEAPEQTALRLSVLKARAARVGDALVIGADQVASLDGRPLGKPGNHDNAVRQLRALSGRTAEFHTALSVLDSASGELHSRVVSCRVTFRDLDARTIETYLRREQPYDCAGSAKAEGLGIALIARIDTDDPTSLIGLPLIALSEMLARAGLRVL
ncbi:MAG TPA: Maf family nucleotide pyrophosphatase [Burkholderiales bacterium]